MIFMILWSASLLPWEFCSEIFAAGVERGAVTARSEATRQSMSEGIPAWIATAFGLAMTKGCGLAMTMGCGLAMTMGCGLAMTIGIAKSCAYDQAPC